MPNRERAKLVEEFVDDLSLAVSVDDDPSFPEEMLLNYSNKREFISAASLREYVVMVYESRIDAASLEKRHVYDYNLKKARRVCPDLTFVRQHLEREITLGELRYLIFKERRKRYT